jgi:peptidoglycan/xylan/chitin deacetylase (PgdA/CDA1 family)
MTLSVPFAFSTQLRDLEPPIGVRVRGSVHYLDPKTALGQVISGFRLAAKSGDLTDVEGKVLNVGLYPGQILLNGRIASGNPLLKDGDTVAVEDGKDHREPLLREVTKIPGGQPGNPQFFLGRAPGNLVTTKGKLSGKIVSSVFQATGRASRPPTVALTFDDGPGPYTGALLQVLLRYHVRATFFVIGFKAAQSPDVVRAEARGGMAIGNHSWDHPNAIPFNKLTGPQIRDEIGKTTRFLTSIGIATSLFRPPGGSYSRTMIEEARRFDSRILLWDVDPKDWERGRTPRQITQSVLANVRPGAIIDMHDGAGNTPATIRALPAIIKGIRAKGLDLVALS